MVAKVDWPKRKDFDFDDGSMNRTINAVELSSSLVDLRDHLMDDQLGWSTGSPNGWLKDAVPEDTVQGKLICILERIICREEVSWPQNQMVCFKIWAPKEGLAYQHLSFH
jgi:hypothetical protein